MSGLIDQEERNPFEDPAVLQALRPQQQQPIAGGFGVSPSGPSAGIPASSSAVQIDIPGSISSFPGGQPAIVPQTTIEPPPPYTASTGVTPSGGYMTPSGGGAGWDQAAAEESLARRQEELERKAEELQRRENEMMRQSQAYARVNNFPPLPSSCPVQPCFYQDISVDIPMEFQKLVKYGYYLWIAYAGLLAVNVIGSLAYFIASAQTSSNNSSGVTFGMSIFYLILFTPCSFICWFRPLYKAFRSDSSFNFFFFFFVFFFQFCTSVLQSLGIDGWGTVGFISSLSMFTKGHGGAAFAGVLMILIGCLFAAMAVLDIMMLIKVHRIYRSTGASFAKAQQEFAQDVMGNRAVQQAAGNLAASAARSSVEQTWSGSRY